MGIELAQDLKAVHGLDVEAEIRDVLKEEFTREIGYERGTILPIRAVDQYTFAPKIGFMFRNDGKFGRDDMWGLDFEDVFGENKWWPTTKPLSLPTK
jgi:hypothetical protein